jgi:MinD-like ATPase involved in chromosome partitioning or flagellar assembly
MLIACWSAKGGSGTTVVSVALAGMLARRSPAGALLADLGGDVPAVAGLPEPSGPGLGEWLASGAEVPADALTRLEIPGPSGLRILPVGSAGPAGSVGSAGSAVPGRAEVLAAVLAADPRPVVADCGSGPAGPGLAVAAAASVSLLVLRPCYLSLRRALQAPLRPSGVILVSEPGRSLGRSDVEDVLGVAVRAVVSMDPAVARAVDAGLLPTRLPRGLERALRHAA